MNADQANGPGTGKPMTEIDLSKVTRVDIIQEYGALGADREHWADSWTISVQDDGKTLKLFGKGTGAAARSIRNQALAEFIADHVGGVE